MTVPSTADAPPAAAPAGLRGTIPNTLTALRVVVAVVFFAVLTYWRFEASAAWNGQTDWWLIFAAGLFIVAGLTDVLDGYLARRWSVESTFGRIMDPFADKLLVVGALVFLAGADFWYRTPEMHPLSGHGIQISGVYPWMVVVIFARELLVTSIRAVLEGQGVRFGADWSGKLKMFCQSICVPTCLITIAVTRVIARPDGSLPWGRWTIDITVWVTLTVTALSAVPYVLRCAALVGRWHADRRR